MAIIDKGGRLHGKIGNTVYRTVGNTNIVQARPGRVRQTLSTKESAMEFGMASNCGRILREVYATFSCNSDGRMINRLNTVLLKCIKDSEKERGNRDLHDGNLVHLQGFQFNVHSPMDKVLAVRPVCNIEHGKIRIQLPELNESSHLQQLKYGRSAVLRMMLVAVNFRENYYEYLSYRDIIIGKGSTNVEQDWVPDVILPAGSIVLASISIQYYGLKDVAGNVQSINSKEFNPAEIIGAYHINEEKQGTVNSGKEAEGMRHPLTNYKGQIILNEIARKRKKDKNYQKIFQRKEVIDVDNKLMKGNELPKGKVFYKKE